jgi:hypothetical protein
MTYAGLKPSAGGLRPKARLRGHSAKRSNTYVPGQRSSPLAFCLYNLGSHALDQDGSHPSAVDCIYTPARILTARASSGRKQNPMRRIRTTWSKACPRRRALGTQCLQRRALARRISSVARRKQQALKRDPTPKSLFADDKEAEGRGLRPLTGGEAAHTHDCCQEVGVSSTVCGFGMSASGMPFRTSASC